LRGRCRSGRDRGEEREGKKKIAKSYTGKGVSPELAYLDSVFL
jgi:hypothetical protein